MHMTDSNEPSVMDLLANDSQGFHKNLPRRVNVRRVTQQRKNALEGRSQALRCRSGQSETVPTAGSRCKIAELDEILSGYMQHFALPMQLCNGACGKRVG